ncbi:hypothetical protein GCM10017322_35910 [Paracoccus aerius]|nr:hypothetical protein GCM10017322_35910 [Paracoccus aerius]
MLARADRAEAAGIQAIGQIPQASLLPDPREAGVGDIGVTHLDGCRAVRGLGQVGTWA